MQSCMGDKWSTCWNRLLSMLFELPLQVTSRMEWIGSHIQEKILTMKIDVYKGKWDNSNLKLGTDFLGYIDCGEWWNNEVGDSILILLHSLVVLWGWS